ncbi:MAG: cysteine desulfurase family protein [Phycisphaerales bacterium]
MTSPAACLNREHHALGRFCRTRRGRPLETAITYQGKLRANGAPFIGATSEGRRYHRPVDFVYLDNNATTQPLPAVIEAMRECLERSWANPSSVHRQGIEARRRVELAREAVARLVGCQERELVFTSGGTEAANLAILGSLEAAPERNVLITSRLEHSAVRETAAAWERRGGTVIWAQHEASGVVDGSWLASTLRAQATRIGLVSLMWVNNETGVIQPVDSIGALCREHGVRFHTDATQWVGKMPTDLASMQIDLASFAAHKFHGPKGVGALYARRGVRFARQVIGGPQERDRRGGTENVPGIAGFGVAADAAREWLATAERDRLASERDRLEAALRGRCDDASVTGAAAPRLWNTTNVGFRRLEAEAILILLSERGVCASAGAACSSGSLDPSPVLLAMGVPADVAHGSIRLSLSRHTTTDELDRAIEEIAESIAKLRRGMAAV